MKKRNDHLDTCEILPTPSKSVDLNSNKKVNIILKLKLIKRHGKLYRKDVEDRIEHG